MFGVDFRNYLIPRLLPNRTIGHTGNNWAGASFLPRLLPQCFGVPSGRLESALDEVGKTIHTDPKRKNPLAISDYTTLLMPIRIPILSTSFLCHLEYSHGRSVSRFY